MSSLIRDARLAEGLTQAQLARRLGVSQPSVARLEKAEDTATVATLRRALNAMGRGLVLQAVASKSSIDETLLRSTLSLTPAQRMQRFDQFYTAAQELRAAGVRARAAA